MTSNKNNKLKARDGSSINTTSTSRKTLRNKENMSPTHAVKKDFTSSMISKFSSSQTTSPHSSRRNLYHDNKKGKKGVCNPKTHQISEIEDIKLLIDRSSIKTESLVKSRKDMTYTNSHYIYTLTRKYSPLPYGGGRVSS